MKQVYPAADRNREPIAEALRAVLPEQGRVLEIASGTGQHVVHFAARFPRLTFLPSDMDPELRASVAAYVGEAGLSNVEPPRNVDVTAEGWEEPVDAVICSNMIHIAPWAATLGLFRGASRCLAAGAPLVLYGPFRFSGQFTSPSNETFDLSLRERNPEWGVRDVADLTEVAAANGFALEATVAMPANNHVLVFRRTV